MSLAFLFPGQGSQFIGMGKNFWNDFLLAKRRFEEASDAISLDIKKLCFDGNMNELTLTKNAQPAILTVSVIAFDVYMQEMGIPPNFLAGHSLGEYSALVCAGALSFQDAVRLVRQRGIIMQHADPEKLGTMAAVSGIRLQTLQEWCEEISTEEYPVQVACMNTDEQHVISGHRHAVQKVLGRSDRHGTKHSYLPVSAPFHSPMMKPAAEQFQLQLDQCKFEKTERPIVSNVTAVPYRTGDSVAELLKLQMTMPVRWVESMHYLLMNEVNEVIEFGPKPILTSLMKKITNHAAAYSFSQPADLQVISDSSKRKDTIFHARKKLLHKMLVKAVIAKNYNQDSLSYTDLVTPLFAQLQLAQERAEKMGDELTEEELNHSIHLCKTILAAKHIPVQEQLQILK